LSSSDNKDIITGLQNQLYKANNLERKENCKNAQLQKHLNSSLLSRCSFTLFVPVRTKAITYGYVDKENTYSNVGAFIVKSPSGEIYPLCSGTLITSNVFLTASHCTEYFTNSLAPQGFTAYVSFDKSIPSAIKQRTN
jgi:hypothetical protein